MARHFICLLLLAAAMAGHATTIQVVAVGTVQSSDDGANAFGFGPDPVNPLGGAAVTATWTYDTADAGPATDDDPDVAHYAPLIDWIDSSVTFGLTDASELTFADDGPVGDADYFRDYVHLETPGSELSLFSASMDLPVLDQWSSQLTLVSPDLVPLSLVQTLLWEAGDPGAASGFVAYFGNDSLSSASWAVESVAIATVPLPAAAWLFLTALLALIFCRSGFSRDRPRCGAHRG